MVATSSQTTLVEPLSVGELTGQIKDLLEARLFNIWVQGELSALKLHHSGHAYLTLKDAEARIDAVVWRTTVQRLRYRPDVGDQVLAFGRISVYPPRGGYQLVIEDLQPAGAGRLHAAFEALKKRLGAEGLFDAGRKRGLPLLPRKVGVVTSATGAARRDIEAVIQRRAPQIPIVLCAARVQGPGAAEEVAAALATVARAPGVDVVIVGRGGGSMEDLWAFNEEVVARAIAACPVPVISAVGHETDTTIADLVADLRAPTPSAAAEAAVPERDQLLAWLDATLERLDRALEARLERRRTRLAHLERALARGLAFHDRRLTLHRLGERLARAMDARIEGDRLRLRRLEGRVRAAEPGARVADARRRLALAAGRLQSAAPALTTAPRVRLRALTERLEADLARRLPARRADWRELLARLGGVSPLAALGRGYSITLHGGRPVRAHDEVRPGDTLDIMLHRGRVRAEVRATAPGADSEDQ